MSEESEYYVPSEDGDFYIPNIVFESARNVKAERDKVIKKAQAVLRHNGYTVNADALDKIMRKYVKERE